MGENYQPPFAMNEEITNLIVEIGEYIGSITTYDAMRPNPVLRRENRIKMIHSSLAIEQNTLTGSFRSGNIGVYAGTELVHAGTPAKYVPDLMRQLFTWLKQSKYHPLVKSCIFHYEFEFIHPFADGNGRTGRLWQSLILQKWKDVFAWIPVETLVYENQKEYYKVLQQADKAGDSTPFVEFMLGMIRNALMESANMLSVSVGITGRQAQRILAKLKDEGRIIRHGANKKGYWEVINR